MIEYENLAAVNKPYQEKFENIFKEFLKNGWFILGEQVRLFEEEFAKYCGTKHCIGLANGLDALYLSMIALKLPKGSEVIVPSNTYIATILSIVNAGFKPVLVEPKLETYNINPDLIEQAITKNTKAIMVVHLYGKPCEMEKIMEIANHYQIPVIEDCAQSHGAHINQKYTGTFGKFGAFSFYPTKNLGALGDAGAIITDDDDMALELRALRNYGSHQKYHNEYVGVNSRLDEIQAALLRVKLKDLNVANMHKKNLASIYFSHINHELLTLPIIQDNINDVHHIFNVRLTQRDRLKLYLLEKHIKTEIHYPVPPHQQKCFHKYFRGLSFPISELIHQTTISLPISNALTVADIERISLTINNFYRS